MKIFLGRFWVGVGVKWRTTHSSHAEYLYQLLTLTKSERFSLLRDYWIPNGIFKFRIFVQTLLRPACGYVLSNPQWAIFVLFLISLYYCSLFLCAWKTMFNPLARFWNFYRSEFSSFVFLFVRNIKIPCFHSFRISEPIKSGTQKMINYPCSAIMSNNVVFKFFYIVICSFWERKSISKITLSFLQSLKTTSRASVLCINRNKFKKTSWDSNFNILLNLRQK